MIGKTLGHYKILNQLGKGGMGEVYLAVDTTLDRKVALKFLPDAFTSDPERMARFEREAKLLASLNHPNIAGIYGLEQADGKRFLVLEYVEGETLQARLSKGALPLEDALALCRQIAEGLEAAHEKGVIHRDLKPANVMITAEEKVKILDFGLAKAFSDETQSIDSSQSPTVTEAMTRPGVILGTAAYMSPEQAKGKSVDKRADIWAFGCILYECLTGKKAFEGETVTETLAAVIRGEPNFENVPSKARSLLRRCLFKDPRMRLRDIGDADALLELTPESESRLLRSKHTGLVWSIVVLSILIAITLAFVYFREEPSLPGAQVRFKIALPDEIAVDLSDSFALSPDGRYLAFTAADSDSVMRLWVRPLDSLEAHQLTGTESKGIPMFFWSPDGRSIAFDAGGKLKIIGISGDTPQPVCELSMSALGGSWNRDGVIIFGTGPGGLMRVSASGGKPSAISKRRPERQEIGHYYPIFLPDGQHFLYLCLSALPENTGVYVGSLEEKPENQPVKKLLTTSLAANYVPASDSIPGQILFLRESTLMSQPFDEQRLEPTGDPIPLFSQVGSFAYFAFFSASNNGVLVYRSPESKLTQATLFDRQGRPLDAIGKAGVIYGVAISPNETQAAIGLADRLQDSALSINLWLLDLLRNIDTPFTVGKNINSTPVWSHDNNRIIFASNREGFFDLFQKPASGAQQEELLYNSSETKIPTSCSDDGSLLLYTVADTKNKGDIWMLTLDGNRKAMPILCTEHNEIEGHFSPGMRWIAYVSDETGSNEIYIREILPSFGKESQELGAARMVSEGGGRGPRWKGDGKELYYIALDGSVMAVKITNDTMIPAENPIRLFQAPPNLSKYAYIPAFSTWDVTADGTRFLIPALISESAPPPFNVILNWTSLLEK